MVIDDSCRKPGAVPFKWEIRPGVPKIQQQHKQMVPPPKLDHQPRHSSLPSPQKLKPPPPAFQFHPPSEFPSHSIRSTPRAHSERWRLDQPGCFPTPLLIKRKDSKRKDHVPRPSSQQGCFLDLETPPRWSFTSRRSFSPFTVSPASSSFSSYKSSPRPVVHAGLAGLDFFKSRLV